MDPRPTSSNPPGLLSQLRGQHWFVKLIMLGLGAVFIAPFLFAAAYALAGGGGVLVAALVSFLASGWFLFTSPPAIPAAELPGAGRSAVAAWLRCPGCGGWLSPDAESCGVCGRLRTSVVASEGVEFLAWVLNDLQALRRSGRIDLTTYSRLLAIYESRLNAEVQKGAFRVPPPPVTAAPAPVEPIELPLAEEPSPARQPSPLPPPIPSPGVLFPTAVVTEPSRVPPPPPPPVRPRAAAPVPAAPPEPSFSAADAGRAVIGWAAERQADILLYVGAFLLSVAAIIFVAYQGGTLSGGIRFAVLTAYALGFLGLGLVLHRWERVREAGPVFLALGAILVPVDIVALRTQVLGEDQLPLDVLWLMGSTTCAALYFLLAIRGYGRLYALPGIPATLAAWGSLASVLGLPYEWFGPWFEVVGAVGYVVSLALLPRRRVAAWLLGLAIAISALALLYTHGQVPAEGADRGALPVAYILAATGLVAGLRYRVDLPMLAVLPPLLGMTVGSALWAVFDVGQEWYAPVLAAVGIGYLLVAYFTKLADPRMWGLAAGAAVAFALLLAHGSVAEGGDREALPLTYFVGLSAAAAAYGYWRWDEWAAVLPPLAGLTVITTLWAVADVDLEWHAPVVAAVSIGYLLIARFTGGDHARSWGAAALGATALGVLLAHSAVADGGGDAAALPATYSVALLAAAAAFAAWRWPEWGVVLPPLAGATVISALWAFFEVDPEWYAPVIAAVAFGYLLIAHFATVADARSWGLAAGAASLVALSLAHGQSTAGGDASALPATYAVVFAVASGAYGRWRWPEWAAVMPPLGVMTLATSWWAVDGLAVEWYGAFIALGALGYLVLAEFDRPERIAGWWWSAAATAALALAAAHVGAVTEAPVDRAALPLTHTIVLLGASASFARWQWQWRLAPAAIPALAAMTLATGAWAVWDLPPEWYPLLLTLAAPGYVLLSTRDERSRGRAWMAGAMAVGSITLVLAHFGQGQTDADRGALPAVYAALAASSALAIAYWRLAYREASAVLPPLTAGLGASLGWAAFGMELEWLPVWAAAAAGGVLVPAEFDREQRANWRTAALLGAGGAIFVAHAVASSIEANVPWQLPATYAVCLACSCWDAVRRRDAGVLLPPAIASVFGATVLWAAEVGAEWWAYPALGVAVAMASTSRWWRWAKRLSDFGWAYAVVLAAGATLAVAIPAYREPVHGLVTRLVCAAVLAAAAFGAAGSIARLLVPAYPHLQRTIERGGLLQASMAFVYGAAASLNGVLELHGGDRAWTVAGVGFAAWLVVAALGRTPAHFWTFAPAALAGLTIASVVAGPDAGTLAMVLSGSAVAPLVAFATTRRWALLGVANSFLLLAVWAWWDYTEASMAWLPVAFAAIAAVEWTALIRLRRYVPVMAEADAVIAYLSWGPWIVSASVAGLLLSREQDRLAPGASIVTTEQWALAATVLAMASAAVAGEGFRLRLRRVWMPGSVGLLAAGLMAIATFEPSNVQAYTAPIGAYLVAIALTYRSSPPIILKHLATHEAVMLIGVLFLVLPPAEQSFEPGGGKFGLELIGISLALLAIGLVLHARWLVPAAIVTMTAVSLRLVTGGMVSVPYWAILGIAGSGLLAFGLLVLLERERWDRFRADVVRWWSQASQPGGPLSPPTA